MVFTLKSLRTVLANVGIALVFALPAGAAAQPPSPSRGGTFDQLKPPQQELVRRWVKEYQSIFKRQMDPAASYNRLPMSARTTFQAVTHALMNTKLTSQDGKSLGTALDLVDLVERVSGQVPETRGDRQFRVYVYLKPGAVNKLYTAREFQRGHDNTMYHIGYPINFRQIGGAPSLQFSVTRTGRRADIDIDYRSSSGVNALVSGHLTAANSDVRAGRNDLTHNKRWNGLSNWWKTLMATFVEAPAPEESTEALAPGAESERRRIARGPIADAVHAYLTDWLVDRKPEQLMPLISVRAFPCVAEFGDGSQPDSKLALARILQQMMERTKSIEPGRPLDDIIQAAPYPLPGGVPVQQPFDKLFSLQEVPADVAWAIDCRVRYKMQMAESIPRPPHKMDKTYVVSLGPKRPKQPTPYLIQTWKQQAGEWRLVSFDLKKTLTPPPANLVDAADALPPPSSDEAKLSSTAVELLTTWLVKKQPAAAARYFLEESYACNEVSGESPGPAKPAQPAGQQNLLSFLEEAARQALPNEQLEGVIVAPEAGHPDLRLVSHARGGAFILAEVSGDLLRHSPCGFDHRAAAPAATSTDKGLATSFRLVRAQDEEGAAITLYWKRNGADWRVASYSIAVD